MATTNKKPVVPNANMSIASQPNPYGILQAKASTYPVVDTPVVATGQPVSSAYPVAPTAAKQTGVQPPDWSAIEKKVADITAQTKTIAAQVPSTMTKDKFGSASFSTTSDKGTQTPTASVTPSPPADTTGTAVQTPQQMASAQFTAISQKMSDLYGASLKITEQQRMNTISTIQSQTNYDAATLTAAYNTAESKINEALRLVGGNFGIDKSRVQGILDNQNATFQSLQAGLTKLNADQTNAINNADLEAASQANQQSQQLINFTSSLFSQQLQYEQQQQTAAQNLLTEAVNSGSLAYASPEQLVSMANASGYNVLDLYNLQNIAKSTTTGTQVNLQAAYADLQSKQITAKYGEATAKADIAYKQAQTQYETSGIPLRQAQASLDLTKQETEYYKNALKGTTGATYSSELDRFVSDARTGKYGTASGVREQLIATLQNEFPDQDPSQIQQDIESRLPDGWESNVKISGSGITVMPDGSIVIK